MTTGSQPQTSSTQDIEDLLNEAESLRSPWTHRYDDALNIYDACIVRLAGVDDPGARRALARAKLGKGECYFDLKKDDEARQALEALAAESDGGDPFVANVHAQSLLTVGQKLVKRQMLDEAVPVFRTGLDRFAANPDNAVHNTVSLLLFNLGSALTEQKHDQDALANYERLLIHLQTSAGGLSADETADALWRKGGSLRRLGRKDDALGAWASAIDRFGGNESCAETISEIRLSYAGLLIEAGSVDEASKQCEAVIAASEGALTYLRYATDDMDKYVKWKWVKRAQEAKGRLKDLSPGKANPESGP